MIKLLLWTVSPEIVHKKPLFLRQRKTSNIKALSQAVKRVWVSFMTWRIADKENLLQSNLMPLCKLWSVDADMNQECVKQRKTP